MRTIIKYILLLSGYATIASASLIANCMDLFQQNAELFILSVGGLTLIFMAGVMLNEKICIPGLLMRQHYIYFLISIFLISVSIILCGYLGEMMIRQILGMPPRIKNLLSPWIILGSAGSCILVIIMLLAQGLESLLRIWYKEAVIEENLTNKLRDYIREVQNRLNPETILRMLKEIRKAIFNGKDTVNELILTLSSYLRNQLYEMPSPPPELNDRHFPKTNHWASDFLVQKRWKLWRYIFFQLSLGIVAMDVFFDAPDHPSFTSENMAAFIGEMFCLEILTLINMFWLFRLFRKDKKLRKYLRNVGIMILCFILPIIAVQLATYDKNVYANTMPMELKILSTMGTMITLSLFIGGTAALLLLKFWLLGQRRLILLKAEIVRQEYAFLKKQINPHFLFNVLNNLGIQSVDEPKDALNMVRELEKLIEYQFSEATLTDTTLAKEIGFITSYLTLEKTRHDVLNFEIITDGETQRMFVPTLLFVPFVENAVKYSDVIAGHRLIKIRFKADQDRLLFNCVNTYRNRGSAIKKKSGGLGISNTMRRLNLLYGSDYTYTHQEHGDYYEVVLEIPLGKTATTYYGDFFLSNKIQY